VILTKGFGFLNWGLGLIDWTEKMKGGKDEKVMGPLFPRLHVNDTEKGGPRAPPRNKMALYEQLSVPSQRLHSVPSTLPLPPHHTSNLVPSASSSQGGGHERSMCSSFYIPSSTPAHSAEKVHSLSSDGMNFDGGMEFGRKSIKNGSYKTSNPAGHILSTAECNSTRPHDFSNSKNSSGKQPAEEDDFRVPTYQHGGERGRLNTLQVYPGRSTVTLSPQKSIAAHSNSSSQLPNAGDKSLKWTKNTDLKSRIQGRNPSKQSPKEAVGIKHGTERTASHPSVMERIAEASKHANVPSIDKWPSVSTNERENSHTGNSRLGPQNSFGLLSENNIGAEGNSVEPRCLNDNGIAEKQNASGLRSELGSSASLGNSHRVPNDAENCIKESEGKVLGNVDRVDDESDTSMVDSISGLDISPDDVVGVIGQKHFWKARKAIVKLVFMPSPASCIHHMFTMLKLEINKASLIFLVIFTTNLNI